MRPVMFLLDRATRALAASPARLGALFVLGSPLLGAVPAAQQDQEAPAKDALQEAAERALREAPARTRIGRIRGTRILSRIQFEDPATEPHELCFSAGFPARSRLTLSRDRWRVERFQLGETWFGLDRSNRRLDAEPQSTLLTGPRLDSARFDIAMRRTLFLWPDEGALVGEGSTRTAKVGDIGILIATLDRESGRPTQLKAFGMDGSIQAEFRGITWQRADDRWWPARLDLHVDGRRRWRETVERVEDTWNFTDTWFLPVDRTRKIVGQPNDARLRMIPREAGWVKEVPLPTDAGLDAWRAEGRRALKSAQAELDGLGLKVSGEVHVRLDPEHKAQALLLRVQGSQAGEEQLREVPGWSHQQASLTWTFAAGQERPEAAAFEAVERAANSSGASDGASSIRLDLAPSGQVTVVRAFRVREGGPPPPDQTP